MLIALVRQQADAPARLQPCRNLATERIKSSSTYSVACGNSKGSSTDLPLVQGNLQLSRGSYHDGEN